MKKMNLPAYNQKAVFLHCVDAVPDVQLKDKYQLHDANIEQGNIDYADHSETQTWCNLPRSLWGHPNQIVSGSLTKAELVALYDKYMLEATGPSRSIYDSLKVSAGDNCPYCGFGQVKTLDHYLPKALFPLHAINPHNLVPSCSDCNKGKGASFPLTADKQGLHPYFDPVHFFDERWVFATVKPELPVTVQFSASPPAHWSMTDKSRALAHFADNELRHRYSIQSVNTLSTVIQWRRSTLKQFTTVQFSEHLMEGANNTNLVLNGWERTLYLALAHSEWFCSFAF